jgi:hypothetical protein
MIFRLSLIVALWLAWKRTASLPLCLAFWIIVLIWCVRPIASRRPSAISLVKGWTQQNVQREVLMVTDGLDRLRGEKPSPSRLGPGFGPVYHSAA